MTSLAGLPAYLDLAQAMSLGRMADRHLGLRWQRQGWTDCQMVMALMMLNLAGGAAWDGGG